MNEEKMEDIDDKLDIINMKLEELKKIQNIHDNQIKRLNYNFRYDLLKVRTYNKIIMPKKHITTILNNNHNNDNNHNNCHKVILFFRILSVFFILIYGIYTFPITCRYIYS